MRLSNAAHEACPWVIGQIARDFELLDVWALPVEGGPDDFDSFLEVMTSIDPTKAESPAARALFAVRLRLGAWFVWDEATGTLPIPGCTETTLKERLPEALRDTGTTTVINEGLQKAAGGFEPLYRTDDEWAGEISNATVHGVLHLSWVDEGDGRHRGRLAVYVKPRGRLGDAYMLLIAPFRHLVVYPAMLRQIGRAWDARRVTAPAGEGE